VNFEVGLKFTGDLSVNFEVELKFTGKSPVKIEVVLKFTDKSPVNFEAGAKVTDYLRRISGLRLHRAWDTLSICVAADGEPNPRWQSLLSLGEAIMPMTAWGPPTSY
jgi:hypothetical protein